MRTIIHISDLHFGRADPRLVEALVRSIWGFEPDVVAVSGDLTQRARVIEFMQAREFLKALPQPQIVTPGNHDIPLYNVYGRFVEGLGRFRRYIGDEVVPFYSDGEIAVAAINTARALTFKHGRVNRHALGLLRDRLREAADEAVRILVAHHPIDLPHAWPQRPVGRAVLAIEAIKECRLDLILSGHLHRTHHACPTEKLRIGGHSALLIQAGTAVSTRGRGEANAFNVVRTSFSRISVEQHAWSEDEAGYVLTRTSIYDRA